MPMRWIIMVSIWYLLWSSCHENDIIFNRLSLIQIHILRKVMISLWDVCDDDEIYRASLWPGTKDIYVILSSHYVAEYGHCRATTWMNTDTVEPLCCRIRIIFKVYEKIQYYDMYMYVLGWMQDDDKVTISYATVTICLCDV